MKKETRIIRSTTSIIQVDFKTMSLEIITGNNNEVKEDKEGNLISAIVFKQTIATVGGAIITYLASPETLARGVEVNIPRPTNLRFEPNPDTDVILIYMDLDEKKYRFIFPNDGSIIKLDPHYPVLNKDDKLDSNVANLNRHYKIGLFYGLTQTLTHFANLYCQDIYNQIIKQ